MKNKKGLSMPEDIGMTLIFLIVIVFMILMGFFILLRIRYPTIFGGEAQLISYSIEFVSIANKPYTLAEVISHAPFGDRIFLEQAIESVAASSLTNAGATNLPGSLSGFVNTYELEDYYITIKDSKELMRIQSSNQKCGDNLEGWCVFGICDIGRIEIPPGKNICDSGYLQVAPSGVENYIGQKCCKEVRQGSFVSCGPNSEGVCSQGIKLSFFSKPRCAEHRVEIKQSDCSRANPSTPVCCAPKTEEIQVNENLLSTSIVPLLYKNLVFGTLEVSGK